MSASARTPKITHRDDDSFARRSQRRRQPRRQSTRSAVLLAALAEEV